MRTVIAVGMGVVLGVGALVSTAAHQLDADVVFAPQPAAKGGKKKRSRVQARRKRHRKKKVTKPDETPRGQVVKGTGVNGRWARAPETEQEAAMLDAIGYVDGSIEPSEKRGVTIHDRDRAWQGLNFYTSGHGEAVLADMDGKVLHTWAASMKDIFEGHDSKRVHWRRAALLPNGHVIGVFESLAVFRVDEESNVVWGNPNRAHHDLQVMPDGTLFTLKRIGRRRPEVNADLPIAEDLVVQMDLETGEELRSWSVYEAVQNSEFAAMLKPQKTSGDLFHTNTIDILDGTADHPEFTRGRLLTSLRDINALAVIDLEENRVVWAQKGSWVRQHDPSIIDGGKGLMLFDNLGRTGRSRVLTLEFPALRKEAVLFQGTREWPFLSKTCGTSEQLPNGNVLITESDGGRAFEITREGEVVWEYYNPERAGDEGQYIAALFEMVRLPRDHWTP